MIFGSLFIVFPVYIFFALFMIVFSDPGYVTKKMIAEILTKNGIKQEEIGSTYTMRDVLCYLTENYLRGQGFF